MSKKTQNIQFLSNNQYASAHKLHARWDLLDYAVPKINIHQAGIDSLKLAGNESVLEVGCGDGSNLIRLRHKGHTGKLIGLEINEKMFQESLEIQEKENVQPKIEYVVGSGDALPYQDKSLDCILAFFMLYHMPNVKKALQEWNRVLKDNGKIVVATSSAMNKPKHKKFKKLAENLLNTKAPAQFSSSFNLENGEEQLQDIFQVTEKFIYQGQIQVKEATPYLKAFESIRDMYEPVPGNTDWQKVANRVKTEIEKEIEQSGHFSDDVKRGFFVCTKKMPEAVQA